MAASCRRPAPEYVCDACALANHNICQGVCADAFIYDYEMSLEDRAQMVRERLSNGTFNTAENSDKWLKIPDDLQALLN
jgi:hypothetical protein